MDTLNLLEQLLAIDSPTGYTAKAADFIEKVLISYGFQPSRTNKGAVKCAQIHHLS